MLKALLVEDELYIRQFIKKLLTEVPGIQEVYDTDNAKEAVTLYHMHRPDLVLLDIELNQNGPSGLDVAKNIYQLNKDTKIVFVTGHDQYAVNSFAVHPYSYVLKPIVESKFKKLIAEIIREVERQNSLKSDMIILRNNDQLVHIHKKDLIFVEADRHKSILYTKTGSLESNKSLNELEEMLGFGFLRVHRSYIVNLAMIKCVKEILDRSYEIEFIDYPKAALMSRHHYRGYKKHFDL